MRRAAIVLVVLCGAALAAVEYLNFSGFCYPQRRWLSDTELIEHAIQYNVQKQYGNQEGVVAYNRDCCVVRRYDRGDLEDVLDRPWVRLFGRYVLVVDLWRQSKRTSPDPFAPTDVAMTSCGYPLMLAPSRSARAGGAEGS